MPDESRVNEDKRLIEDCLPIEAISEAALSHPGPEGSHG